MTDAFLEHIRDLLRHGRWADKRLQEPMHRSGATRSEAVREQAHLLGTLEVWLARLEGRPARHDVWPEAELPQLDALQTEVYAAFDRYIDALTPEALASEVTYANSAGDTFTNSVSQILLHVFLHAQYHRGKVNLLLRQAAADPAPADYIAFVRGAPAATSG